MANISINIDCVINPNIHNTKELLKDRLELFKAAGITCLDYMPAHRIITDSEQWVAVSANALSEAGMRVTQTHTPIIGTIDTSSGDFVWEFTDEDKKWLELSFKSNAAYGCHNTVIHPFSPYPVWNDRFLKDTRNVNIEYFKYALEYAHKYDVNICLENMASVANPEIYYYCSNPIELKDLHDILNDERIKYCVDTGHAHYAGNDTADLIEILGSDIAVLHIQDNFGINDGHCLPPFGNIDWEKTAKALKKVGYKGTINFEINGGRAYTLDDEAKIAYLTFAKEMGKYIERLMDK